MSVSSIRFGMISRRVQRTLRVRPVAVDGIAPRAACMATLAVSVLVGCSGEEPEPTAPIGAETSFVVGELRIGDVVYGCGGWSVEPPSGRVVVDLFFARGPDEQDVTRPTAAEVEAVEERGGRVLRRFHVPAVRAELSPGAVADLVGRTIGSIANHARAVPDTDEYNVVGSVGHFRGERSVTLDAFRRSGGYVKSIQRNLDSFTGAIPDDSINGFRERSDLRYFAPSMVMCLM